MAYVVRAAGSQLGEDQVIQFVARRVRIETFISFKRWQNGWVYMHMIARVVRVDPQTPFLPLLKKVIKE